MAATLEGGRPGLGEPGQWESYRGINVLLLGFRAGSTPWWLTLRQAAVLGGRILWGAKSAPVVFWRWAEKGSPEGEASNQDEENTERFPVLRYYRVFNLDQTEGIDEERILQIQAEAPEPVEAAERIVAGYADPPRVSTGPSLAPATPRRATP